MAEWTEGCLGKVWKAKRAVMSSCFGRKFVGARRGRFDGPTLLHGDASLLMAMFGLARFTRSKHCVRMTATEVIKEIERLPADEQHRVFEHVHEMEESLIPDSFLSGMAEAERGELIEMTDAQYENPPA